MAKNMKIIDAHTHFFSYTWMDHFCQLSQGTIADVAELAQLLGWDEPDRDPVALGKKWVAQQEAHGLAGQILFASKLNDAEALAAAVNANPGRLAGYVMVNPNDASARNQTQYALNLLGMKGVLLFPAMHHFRTSDAAACLIYDEAHSADVPVFIHFGRLSIPIFQKLGLDDNIDLQYSNPSDLRQAASDFREVNFIIPHFGCGMLAEALELAGACENIYFDTSSSNSWIQPPLTLEQVFRQTLDVVGPERLLFGTDSSTFPRGWRKDIFDKQIGILTELGLSSAEKQMVLGGNVARLLKLNFTHA